ncbi:MAG: aminotransferase class III-fold pyridoxal phosphate-dependent enzyme [Pyrinomonadaceae bacterium]|nr:aminotransferase class III-fold pyridoxal phosphate-dependent enzyme [Pyrinomonadaceae bacterium]
MNNYEISDIDGLVAVIGMAVRVPGANNLQEFWNNLCGGIDSITHFSNEELLGEGIPKRLLDDPNYVKANGILPEIEKFDADFFGINKREAQITDPQHRLFLECAWEALESAGYNPYAYDGRIGVFASESLNSYFVQNLQTNQDLLAKMGGIQTILGNDRDFLATRLSFILNLRGPSIVLQSACSSSLSAVHLACQSLNNGESDIVLAGGVSISLPQKAGYFYQVAGIYSADGKCRTFDEKATGTVGGNGAGLVVLKRLEDALQEGDHIYSVIRGSAINNDGNAKVGYTAPSVQGQSEVIEEALAVSRVEASSISYVEAHGTGTPLGDPIEVEALTKAFSVSEVKKRNCAIGSVKSNIGHLDAAAGVVGLIKTSLMLKNRKLVPSLYFEKPNPKINFEQSPFYVNVEHRDWKTDSILRAGVSSFGIGGTNVHVVLEEFRENKKQSSPKQEKLLLFSAATKKALSELHLKTADFLEANKNIDLDDAAFTLQIGRKRFDRRSAIVCRDHSEAVEQLRKTAENEISFNEISSEKSPEIAFLFPGQGTQYVGMAREIYQSERVFQKIFDECAEAFQKYLEADLRTVLFAANDDANNSEQIKQTLITQPLMFSVGYALAGLLKNWGIRPAAMIGHSLGEYTAACVAGVFGFEDAVKIIAGRAGLMQKLPKGSMLSVKSAPEKIEEFLGNKLSVAVLNTPDSCVVSGNDGEIERLRQTLAEKKISCKMLETSHAFHSPMMNDILEPFYKQLSEIKLNPPGIPFVSNLTGNWIKESEAVNPQYWVNHLRQTVRFSEGIKCLTQDNRFVLVETGPKSLSILARMQTSATAFAALPAANENVSSLRSLSELVGNLWKSGVEIDWEKYNSPFSERNRLPLPTYPFQRETFWVAANSEKPRETSANAVIEEIKPIREEVKKEFSAENKREAVWNIIREIIYGLTGSQVGEIDAESTFYQLGVDSLLLIQASQEISKKLGVEISFQQILEEYPTINSLASYLTEVSPIQVETFAEKTEPVAVSAVPNQAGNNPVENAEAVIASAIAQLQSSLAALKNGNGSTVQTTQKVQTSTDFQTETTDKTAQPDIPRYVPFKPITVEGQTNLSEIQEKHLNRLVEKYNLKTAKSKRFIEESRQKHADSRLSLNFRRIWKEMVYPIIGDKSQGSKIWDIDGNKYLDLTMGFGVNLFGHSPDFIKEALAEQLEKGLHLGPQSNLAGEVSELFCDLTGNDRAAFTVSGTEAVMIAMRLARTYNGRDKIVCFSGSYHGSVDSVLVRQSNEKGNFLASPLAPGIPKQAVADTFVLEYDDPQSLEVILNNSNEISAVMVEAIQSRRPDLKPKEFLEKLRAITAERNIVLIFDEIITGFRLHPQGAQGYFGIKADLSTYGKVIGGGLPVGVVAGKSEILNAIDGGLWHFGDSSYPDAKQTYMAGTFYKHPLGMAAMRAILRHLKQEGSKLQEKLNAVTTALVNRLNAFFRQEELPISVVQCGSLFRFNLSRNIFLGDLFFYHLIEKGVYIWEGRNCFVSTAHTQDDLDFLFDAVVETVKELKNNGFLTETISTLNTSDKNGSTQNIAQVAKEDENKDHFPLTEGQQQIWLSCQISETASTAYNESVILNFTGNLNFSALTESVNRLVARHEALRVVFGYGGDYQKILPELQIEVKLHDLTSKSTDEKRNLFESLVKKESQTPFDLVNGPLLRASVIKENEEKNTFCLTIHHLVTDGWSFSILLKELKEIYTSITKNQILELPPPASYREFTEKQIAAENADAILVSEQFWLEEFSDSVPVADLPLDFPRPDTTVFSDDEVKIDLDEIYLNSLRKINKETSGTTFTTLLTVFNLALKHITRKNDFIVGIHTAGQLNSGAKDLVGYYVNLLPLRTKIKNESRFTEYFKEIKYKLFEIYKHQNYPLGKLIKKLNPPRLKGRSPFISVTFNSFRASEKDNFGDLQVETGENSSGYSRFDLNLNILEWDDRIECQFIFNKDIFKPETVTSWLHIIGKILSLVGENLEISVGEIFVLLDQYEESLTKNKQKEFQENRLASLRRITRKTV